MPPIFDISKRTINEKEVSIIKACESNGGYPDLDFENTVQLRELFSGLLKENKVNIILSMENISLMSSYTVGVFSAFHRNFRDKNGSLVFCHLEDRPQRTFQATRIDQILNVYPTLEDALQHFQD